MNSKHEQHKDNINNNFICILDNNDPSLYDLGIQSLKGNNFGVVILAGGQGSRLGSDLPKALFKLNGKPLIEYHIERIIKIQEEYGCSITLFIMVSSFTEKEIKNYLKNNNFNLKIEIIKQEDRECVRVKERDDKNEDKDKEEDNKEYINKDNNNTPPPILKAPGGNGDVFKSLSNLNLNSFIGINVISVDNVIAKVLDPVFVGGFIKNNLEILSKAVKKRENENVGVFLIKSEGLRIREYNVEGMVGDGKVVEDGNEDEGKVGGSKGKEEDTLKPTTNHYPTTNPSLDLYGNICNHLFSPSFIKKMSKIPLKEHSVLKKIPFLKNGQWVKPSEPNGFKIGTFIFDCFEYATRNGFLKVKREEEFAPLKNGNESKEDNPRTCEEALGKRGEGMGGVVR